jgi:hypothetical protein
MQETIPKRQQTRAGGEEVAHPGLHRHRRRKSSPGGRWPHGVNVAGSTRRPSPSSVQSPPS